MTKSETLKRQIKAGQANKAYSQEDLAIKMHMSIHQLRRRLANPDRIPFGELERFEKVLGIKILA